VLTFEPHPREFFKPDAPKLRLMSMRDKIYCLRELGFANLYIARFDAGFSATSAEDFVSHCLLRNLKARHITTGENFCFGAGRRGDSTFLTTQSAEKKFSYNAVAPVKINNETISSSAVRGALAEGNIAHANMLLGKNFTLSGHVVHGDKRGRTLGFRTANLSLRHYFVPKKGVYAVRAHVDNKHYLGVANIGTRPSFGGTCAQLEAHLFDFSGDIYGEFMHIELCHFIREEQKFSDSEIMKNQLHHDVETAREFFA